MAKRPTTTGISPTPSPEAELTECISLNARELMDADHREHQADSPGDDPLRLVSATQRGDERDSEKAQGKELGRSERQDEWPDDWHRNRECDRPNDCSYKGAHECRAKRAPSLTTFGHLVPIENDRRGRGFPGDTKDTDVMSPVVATTATIPSRNAKAWTGCMSNVKGSVTAGATRPPGLGESRQRIRGRCQGASAIESQL